MAILTEPGFRTKRCRKHKTATNMTKITKTIPYAWGCWFL